MVSKNSSFAAVNNYRVYVCGGVFIFYPVLFKFFYKSVGVLVIPKFGINRSVHAKQPASDSHMAGVSGGGGAEFFHLNFASVIKAYFRRGRIIGNDILAVYEHI